MRLDLSPAKWIWLPSQRTLANTVVLFRREVHLARKPSNARGWIAADSRYRLWVNGQRVQWGPAPHDPRHAEADLVDLTGLLVEGENVIGVEVLFYGHGEGTWPFGKPGLLLSLDIDGHQLVTDSSWLCQIDRGHRPGQYRRWFLRALQEEFDARAHPNGWNRSDFDPTGWLPAAELRTPADKPAYSGGYSDYANEIWHTKPEVATLAERSIPLLKEEILNARLVFEHRVKWHRSPEDWFEFRMPGSFEITENEGDGLLLTYELEHEIVGFPRFQILAPEGTLVHLMTQESYDPSRSLWMDSHHFAWSKFVCREGLNEFECLDYEAMRHLQLHVYGHRGSVDVRSLEVRRRIYDWPGEAVVRTSDPLLQRLFDASIRTLDNSAQDIVVDGMGRERQQYSGDGAHQLHPVRQVRGAYDLSARFLRQFAYGQMQDGVFADSWPAVDRLQRLWQRNVDSSSWGPLVDHSLGFLFDHYHHLMQSGDLEPVRENWPRLMKFVEYLQSIQGEDGLLPIQDLGVNAVWIDHVAYRKQRDKQLALNLYAAAALQHAMVPMAQERGEDGTGFREFAEKLWAACRAKFWSDSEGTYVCNLPWLDEDGEVRFCDRSLSHAVLHAPGDSGRASRILAECPPSLGISYPCNAVWRYWALAKAGRIDVVIKELRTRWAEMPSVRENGTIQENWTVTPGSTDLYSHCAQAPLIMLHQAILGITPLEPGYRRWEMRPQFGDIESLEATHHTPAGPIEVRLEAGLLSVEAPLTGTLIIGDTAVDVPPHSPVTYRLR